MKPSHLITLPFRQLHPVHQREWFEQFEPFETSRLTGHNRHQGSELLIRWEPEANLLQLSLLQVQVHVISPARTQGVGCLPILLTPDPLSWGGLEVEDQVREPERVEEFSVPTQTLSGFEAILLVRKNLQSRATTAVHAAAVSSSPDKYYYIFNEPVL